MTNQRNRLIDRLPTKMVRLLRQLGALADERAIALYLVGGVVRDLLLKRRNWDLDLTVEGDGIAFARLVADRHRAGIAIFERFATARLAMPNGIKIDIASTRRESYARPAALPDVEPASLKEDLYRRDFTINAMAIQLNAAQFGQVHDPYGGQRDLKAKTLRVLHAGSFVDDPTRIYRAIRFMQRFGFRLEAETGRLLQQAAATDLIDRLSGPRLSNELFLLFGEREPSTSIEALVRLKLLRFVHRRLRYGPRVWKLVAALSGALAWWNRQLPKRKVERPLVYLMALLSQAGPALLQSVSRRLQLSARQADAVEWAGRSTDRTVHTLMGRKKVTPAQTYRLLIGLPDEAMLLLAAKGMAVHDREGLRRLTGRITRFLKKDRHATSILRGEDLKELGLKPGPQFKTILDRLLDARVNGHIRTKAQELAFLRRVAKLPG